MRFFTLLTVCFLLTVPASAGAVQLVNPDGTTAHPFQAWANASKMPTSPSRILVMTPTTPNSYDYCSGQGSACAYGGQFPSINFVTPDSIRQSVLMHELGHAYDYSMPSRKRKAFYEITGYGPAWRGGPNPAAERFAEAYSYCARGVKNVGKRWSGNTYLGRWHGGYDYSPRSPQVHHAVCRLIQA